MTEMQLIKPDLTALFKMFADGFRTKEENGQIVLPSQHGTGYIRAEHLPSGITVMVSDTVLKLELIVERKYLDEHFFILQFNEEFEDFDSTNPKNKKSVDDFQSVVKLSHTLVSEQFVFPSNKRLRSVKFYFHKDQLYSLLGKAAVEKLLNQFFPAVIKNNMQMPIATEYRVMLDDLWSDKIEQPLKLNYIQNRVLLLLEKYICKLYEIKDLQVHKIKRSDDETLRLMKVESLLVKDFSVDPPKIKDLSRISAMSPTKLKSDFKQLYGFPIYQYFQKNRMLKAKSLLVLGKYTIKEVGIKVGYSNLSHFASAFKKEFGYLPSSIALKDGMLVYGS